MQLLSSDLPPDNIPLLKLELGNFLYTYKSIQVKGVFHDVVATRLTEPPGAYFG